MDLFSMLSMVGGLALFLYGMHLLGDGLAALSGGRLERILEKLTSNPVKAVLLGAGVTAVIQSSSATTVMVVGFVNSGIMKLSQAVGIIMGANIGTTVTSWILSLAGLQGENLLIQLLKPTSFAPIFAMVGVVMLMASKKEKMHNIAYILVGFAILMTGMDTMSAAVKPLADVPEFTNILLMFSNPVLGIIAGAVLTAIIQSSSASVGILQALCMTGAVPYSSALPIIMGQNIGTCITALLSGIGATKNAKRAAVVHLYFNLIGTTIFMIAFYLLNILISFEFLDQVAAPAGIAMIHSIFNVMATLALLPFSHGLEKLACLTIRDKKEEKQDSRVEEDLGRLDIRFLETPAYAIKQSRHAAVSMAHQSKDALYLAFELLKDYDEEKAGRIVELERHMDQYEVSIGNYLVKLSSRELSQKERLIMTMILNCIGEFESISDYAVNLLKTAEEKNKKELVFSGKAEKELEIFFSAMKNLIETTMNIFYQRDIFHAKDIYPLEKTIDYLSEEMKKRHLERLCSGDCNMEQGSLFLDIIMHCERISDRCSSIAAALTQSNKNGFDAHGLGSGLVSNDMEFKQKCQEYIQIYQLP